IRTPKFLFDGLVAAIPFRKFLLDDVSLDGDAKVICLTGEIGGGVHIAFGSFELWVPQIAPENAAHTEFVSFGKDPADLCDLSGRFLRTKIDRGAYRDRTQVVCLPNSSK